MSDEETRRPGSAKVFDRADFLRVLLAAGAAALGVFACSDSGSDDQGGSGTGGSGTGGSGTGGGGGDGCAQDIDAQITCRHDHSLIVTAADITAGVDKIYDIQGTNAIHGHDVTVTAADFARLRAGETVEIAVPSQFQPHTIYLSCAGLDPHARDEEACI